MIPSRTSPILGLLLLACSVSAQGIGLPASTGAVPSIDVLHRQTGSANAVTLSGFAPAAPIVLAANTVAAPFPLASFGFGPGVLGPALANPSPLLIQNLVADGAGALTFAVTIPPVIAHVPFHVQAGAPDAGAPWGLALSEHRVFIFGDDPDLAAIAVPVAPGRHAFAEVFTDGSLGAPVDPRLLDVQTVDAVLTNTNEMLLGRHDRPVVGATPVGDAVMLPGGARLHMVQSPTFERGIVRVGEDARLQVVAWAQGTSVDPAFEPEMAASAHQPWAAVVSENPLPEYGNATLVLVRTDGENVPGSHRHAVGITTPPGLEVESTCLCFLDGALFYGDGATELHRLDLTTLTSTPVAFPLSGGQPVVYMDETCAPAENGTLMCLGAGQSDVWHDIYAVHADGTAINVTQFPGDYEDAGPGDADGMQLVVDPTGQRVAYMRTVIETETFVHDIGPPFAEHHVTNGIQFIDSIDTVIGVRFIDPTWLHMAAGQDETATDIYASTIAAGAPSGSVTAIANASQTSGILSPPFGLGASLTHTTQFGYAGGAALWLQNAAGADKLMCAAAGGTTLDIALDAMPDVVPLASGFVVTDSIAGAVRVRSVTGDTVASSWTAAGPGSVEASTWDETHGAAFVITEGLARVLVRVEAGGTLTTHATIADEVKSISIEADGSVIAVARTGSAWTTRRWSAASGGWTTLAPALPAVFLR